MTATTRRSVLAGFAATAALGPARAENTKLTIMVFQGLQNLPLYAAETKGFFAKRGLEVDIKIAPNSGELRQGLADGRYQIVHSAVDNALAMAEVAKVDIGVVIGGDNSWNRLVVQPEITSYADLRGKTVAVDAVDTAYAFQLYEMLAQNGLKKGDYVVKPVGATFRRVEAVIQDKTLAATMLNPPFSINAERAGLKEMAIAVKAIGPYQGSAGFVLRSWGKANEDLLVRYLQAYIEGVRWVLDRQNESEAVGFLMKRLRLPENIATQTYAIATDPAEGMARDARIDLEGFRNVLKLRAIHGGQGGDPPPAEKYIDLSYYQKALAGL